MIIDNSNLLASFRVYFQVHHAVVEAVISAFHAPDGPTSLFITVWETGYA